MKRATLRLASIIGVLTVFALVLGVSAEPEYGGTLVIGMEGDVNYLNPAVWISSLDLRVNSCIFDQVVIIGRDGTPEPQLATHWDVSADGKTITFYIKEGVKWHDGEPFTARDVAFTFYAILSPSVTSSLKGNLTALVDYDKLTDPDNPVAPEDLPLEPIEVLDEYTIRFHLQYADPTFFSLAMDVGIIPAHLLEAEIDAGQDLTESAFNQAPVGCGQFKFVEWQRDERIVLEAYEEYHAGRPYLDTVVFSIIPDYVVLSAALESGEVDFVQRIQEADLAHLKELPHLQFESNSILGYGGVTFNCENPVFSDRRVRAAINYAVDVEAMVHTFIGETATISFSPFSPRLGWAFNPNLDPYPFDRAKALALLQEAGWEQGADGVLRNSDGEAFRFVLNTFDFSTPRKQSCVFIQEQLSQIGMEVEVEFLATPVLLSNLQVGAFEAAFVAYGTKADPDDTARDFETGSIGGANWSRYSNPYFDTIAAEARSSMDQARRQELYWKAAEILRDDAPTLWAYHDVQHHGWNAKFKGWVFNPDATGLYKRLHLVYMER